MKVLNEVLFIDEGAKWVTRQDFPFKKKLYYYIGGANLGSLLHGDVSVMHAALN